MAQPIVLAGCGKRAASTAVASMFACACRRGMMPSRQQPGIFCPSASRDGEFGEAIKKLPEEERKQKMRELRQKRGGSGDSGSTK